MKHRPFNVMAGLDPAIHPLRKMLYCRVKPGNAEREGVTIEKSK